MEGSRLTAWKDLRGAAFIAAAAGVYVVLASGVVAPRTSQIISNHAMTLFPYLAAIFSFVAAWRSTGRTRGGWILLGAWGVLSGTGNAIWEYYEFVLHQPVPFPSAADAGYLGGNLCAVFAVGAFAMTFRRVSRARAFLDALLIGGSVFLVSWSVLLQSLYEGSGGTFLEQAVGLAYPVLDVVIVSLIVFVASSSVSNVRVPLVLIGVGLLGWAVSDTSFAYLTLVDAYRSGHPIDFGWIAGDALIAYVALRAALRPSHSREELVSRPAKWRIYLPYVAGGIAAVVGIGVQIARGETDALILSGVMVLLLVIVGRQFLSVVEQQSTTIEHMRSVDEMKNGILRAVSHELRTPLTFINGAAAMLADSDGALSPDDRRELVDGLVRNGSRLDDFLTGLLDLERLTRGIIEPARRQTDVRNLLVRVTEAVGTSTHHIHIGGDPLWANIDAAQVERIAENLFVNAVRHTPAGTRVEAFAESTAEGILLTVADEGPGVPDDLKQAIFRPFMQGSESIEAGRGTGVGLALVANFARLHGGRAWVDDRQGGGASFKVLLAEPTSAESRAA